MHDRSASANRRTALFVVAGTCASTTGIILLRTGTGLSLQSAAYAAAGLAVILSLCALPGAQRRAARRPAHTSDEHTESDRGFLLNSLALTAAAVSAFVFLYLLCVRVVYRILEIRVGSPHPEVAGVGGDADLIFVPAALAVVCVAYLAGAGDRRFVTPLLWTATGAGAWCALLPPLFRVADDGLHVRTAGALWLTVWLAVLVCGFVFVQSWLEERRRWHAAQTAPDQLLRDAEHWPGLRSSAGVLGVAVLLLVFYQLAATPLREPFGHPWSAVVPACAAGLCGSAMFVLLRGKWNRNLGDIGMALTTVGAAAFFVMFVPAEPEQAGARFPMIFNAVMIALAVGTWCWIEIGCVWTQQLDDGRSWTAAGHLSKYTDRFAFFAGFTALVVGMLMAVWPRLRPIAEDDDSLPRVAFGVAGHLLLVLVLIRCGRRTGRSGFGVLASLAMISLLVFIAVRALPFASVVYTGTSEPA